MTRTTSILATGAALVLLAGCGTYRYERTTEGAPPEFTQALASEYEALWKYEANEMYDWIDAEHFTFKAASAGRGETPLPENVDRWDIPQEHQAELRDARERLMRALDGGGRERAPRVAARAQVAYDCWVEQQEENWQTDHIAACRNDFEKALAALEARPVAQAAAPQPPPAQTAPVQPSEYRVFFDWDRATLDETAERVLDAATRQMRTAMSGGTPGAAAGASAAAAPTMVLIEGHADRSGPDDYNMGLSQRRAETVRQALIQRGWPADRIEIRAFGEEDPLVATEDGVREPSNRRVRITFQTR